MWKVDCWLGLSTDGSRPSVRMDDVRGVLVWQLMELSIGLQGTSFKNPSAEVIWVNAIVKKLYSNAS